MKTDMNAVTASLTKLGFVVKKGTSPVMAHVETIANMMEVRTPLHVTVKKLMENANANGYVVECGPEFQDAGMGMIGPAPDAGAMSRLAPAPAAPLTPPPPAQAPAPAHAPSQGQEKSEFSAFQQLLDWAESHGCPPEICSAAKTALSSEGAEAGVVTPVPPGPSQEVDMGTQEPTPVPAPIAV